MEDSEFRFLANSKSDELVHDNELPGGVGRQVLRHVLRPALRRGQQREFSERGFGVGGYRGCYFFVYGGDDKVMFEWGDDKVAAHEF